MVGGVRTLLTEILGQADPVGAERNRRFSVDIRLTDST